MHHPDDHEPGGGMPRGRVRRPLVLSHRLWSSHAWPRLVGVAVALVAVYWLADRMLIDGPPPGADVAVLDAVARWRGAAAVGASRTLTFLGDLAVVVAVWAVLVTLARRRSGRWDLAWLVTAVIGGALLVTSLVKDLTERARPDGALVDALSHAFPSGHAARAAAVWGLVAWLAVRWGRTRAARWTVAAVGVAMALTTGLARLVLGIHWPSDVLFGWLLGAVWLLTCILVVRPRHGVPRNETVLDDVTDLLSSSLLDDGAER